VPADKKLILASASPRRREILTQLGVSYDIDPADIDESPLPGESPEVYVKRMAVAKAAHVAPRHSISQVSVLGADTTVVIDGDVLGKPADHFDGLAMLARLSGREHIVMTAICLLRAEGPVTRLVQTRVQFVQLVRAQCEAYLSTDEPWDKAGGYAIQGRGGAFVRAINGSYSNVVGLPMSETWELLSGNGIATGLESSSE
jgi:septum formation protein